MTTFSVLLPVPPTRVESALPFAALVKECGAHRLWQGQTLGLDPHQMFAYLAAAGYQLPAGIGVTLTPLRHPLEAALQARSVAAMTNRPLVAGFGPGAAILQRNLLGEQYARPLSAMREYLTIVRDLLAGEAVDRVGTYFSQRGELPPLPGPSVQIELGLGVLRPAMARLAGELADVAITWLTPPTYLTEQVMPALRASAVAAGRAVPWVTAVVPMALRRAGRDPVELAAISCGGHLQLPHYRQMLHRAGVALGEADLRMGARALVESDAFYYDDAPQLLERLDKYRVAGVDEVVVNMTGVGLRYGASAALADLTTLFDTIERH